ncbi:MAG: GNAT family N-acetyltransferase [Pseudomonadota bacterium]
MIPILQTEHLVLRGWRLDDFAPYRDFVADDHANRFRGGARTGPDAWNDFAALSGEWALRGYGAFALGDRTTGRLAGWCGLWHPAHLDEPELCWSVFPAFGGRGYATEAAGRALRWVVDDLGLAAPFSLTDPNNIASQRVAEKLGAEREADIEFEGRLSFVYRHRHPAAKALSQAS